MNQKVAFPGVGCSRRNYEWWDPWKKEKKVSSSQSIFLSLALGKALFPPKLSHSPILRVLASLARSQTSGMTLPRNYSGSPSLVSSPRISFNDRLKKEKRHQGKKKFPPNQERFHELLHNINTGNERNSAGMKLESKKCDFWVEKEEERQKNEDKNILRTADGLRQRQRLLRRRGEKTYVEGKK